MVGPLGCNFLSYCHSIREMIKGRFGYVASGGREEGGVGIFVCFVVERMYVF